MNDKLNNLFSYNEITKSFINNKYKIKKSYFKNNDLLDWNVNRCRIDISLFENFIFDYITTDLNEEKLTEKYLNLTRSINKVHKNYQKSNGMDGSAIINWFSLKKINKDIDNINYFDLRKSIKEYINFTFENKVYKNNSFREKWIRLNVKSNIDNQETFSNYINNLSNVKENKIIDISDLIPLYQNKQIDYRSLVESEINKKFIGDLGKTIANKYLCETYGDKNIFWKSRYNKYSNYDFEINHKNSKKFIEVKSTSKPNNISFFLSKFEFDFYRENINNYWILFISNINANNIDYNPIIKIFKNPKIIIDNNKNGYDKKIKYYFYHHIHFFVIVNNVF